jgi:hypothetical protein
MLEWYVLSHTIGTIQCMLEWQHWWPFWNRSSGKLRRELGKRGDEDLERVSDDNSQEAWDEKGNVGLPDLKDCRMGSITKMPFFLYSNPQLHQFLVPSLLTLDLARFGWRDVSRCYMNEDLKWACTFELALVSFCRCHEKVPMVACWKIIKTWGKAPCSNCSIWNQIRSQGRSAAPRMCG